SAGRSRLVVLPVLAAEIPRRQIRRQARADRSATHRGLPGRRYRLRRGRLAVERADQATLDGQPGSEDRDVADGPGDCADRLRPLRGCDVDCRADRQHCCGGASGLVGQCVYARERHVSAVGGGLDLGDWRVRRRYGRRLVPTRHGPHPRRQRPRLHTDLPGLRARLRDGVGDYPAARPPTRACSREGAAMLAPLLLLLLQATSAHPSSSQSNQLTAAEHAAGWRLLFDGRTLAGWRGLGYDTVPTAHWVVVDGAIKKIASGDVARVADGRPLVGGDLMTVDSFADFELSFEWKVTPGANSGVKYNVSETMSMAQGGAGTSGGPTHS